MAASPTAALATTGTGVIPEAMLIDREAGATQEERAGGLSFPSRDMAVVLVAMWVVSSALSRPGTGQGCLVGCTVLTWGRREGSLPLTITPTAE